MRRRIAMLTRDEILTMLSNHYPHLAAEYAVKRIGVFGSYASDSPTETSDIDLVIEFDHPIGFKFMELNDYLEHLLGKPVDILTPTGIADIRLAHVAQRIKEHIIYVETQ
jgi:predicted nucleotidyltransferase